LDGVVNALDNVKARKCLLWKWNRWCNEPLL
jgi:hypothetical protein